MPLVVAVFSATKRILATSSATADLGLAAALLVAGLAPHENVTLLCVLVVTRSAMSPMVEALRAARFVLAGLGGALAPLRFGDGGPAGEAAGAGAGAAGAADATSSEGMTLPTESAKLRAVRACACMVTERSVSSWKGGNEAVGEAEARKAR